MMEEMLRRIAAEAVEEERRKPKPLPEAIVMELREAAKRYSRPNPFKVGDLITPARSSYYNGCGEPHLVIDTCPGEYRWDANNGSPHYGIRIDTRVLQIMNGSMAAFWIESAQFDAWTDPSAKPEPETAAAKTTAYDEYVTTWDGVTVPSGLKVEVPVTSPEEIARRSEIRAAVRWDSDKHPEATDAAVRTIVDKDRVDG